jgi:hypothetical protein
MGFSNPSLARGPTLFRRRAETSASWRPWRAFAAAVLLASAPGLLAGEPATTLASGVWLATGPNNSLAASPKLFSVETSGGEETVVTRSTATNIHDHVVVSKPVTFQSFTGELRIDDAGGGVGVTFFSRYPYSDHYYRLRRYGTRDFELAPHGTSLTGDLLSGVVPKPKEWYRFRVELSVSTSETRVRARIWLASATEPTVWQMSAIDVTPTRNKSGTIGCWSMGPGTKLWRRLRVDDAAVALLPPPETIPQVPTSPSPEPTAGGSITDTPDSSFDVGDDIAISDDSTDTDGALPPPSDPADSTGDLGGVDDPVAVEDPAVPSSDPTTDADPPAGDVANVAPTIDIRVLGDRSSAAGTTVAFVADVVDDGDDVSASSVSWSFSDGTTATGIEVEHNFAATGVFTVGVRAVDAGGLSASDEVEVQVVGAGSASPVTWVDTRANNSLAVDDRLFTVATFDGDSLITTASTETNIHSHALGGESEGALSLRGSFRGDDARSGFGVTFLSDYPNSDRYYRLRRYADLGLHIAPHGTTVRGDIESGVIPRAGVWYDYAIEVAVRSDRTEIRARVWDTGSPEPATWQIDAVDDSSTRIVTGRVGCWSMGPGRKLWSRLIANGKPLPLPGESASLVTVRTESERFETAFALDSVSPFRRVEDLLGARSGSGILTADITSGVPTSALVPGPFADAIAPFLLADAIFARVFVRVDQPVSWRRDVLQTAVDEFIAERPGEIDERELALVRRFLAAIEIGEVELPALAPSLWYCLRLSYSFPTAAGAPARLTVELEGTTLLELDDFDIGRDSRVLLFIASLLRNRALETESPRVSFDDLTISEAPLDCQ